ncbi:Rv3235 family protein [Rothia kristinae]|uniref:Rv3235 family protein n=1 Tax=Rothia kristinae TaxID=37923 RepID=UPI0034E0130A
MGASHDHASDQGTARPGGWDPGGPQPHDRGAGAGPARVPLARPQRVRAVCAAPDEYEAAVVVRVEDRCRALALRIHRVRGQWQIVAAEIG